MKKLITCLVIASVFTVTASAQTEKEDWMVGGDFRLNTTKNNTEIASAPNVGYFIINNLAVGGNIIVDYTKLNDDKFTNFGIGPFIRYYFTQANVRPFFHGSMNYLSSKAKFGNNTSSTNSGFSFFLGGGAAIFLSDQVSLDLMMGYNHTKYKDIDGSGGFALSLGFQVYLHKKQVERLSR
jgi:opacity protein-like surface antigen